MTAEKPKKKDYGAVTDFKPPPRYVVRAAVAPQRAYFKPKFLGLDDLDLSKPALFVGNHTRFGMFDAPLMAEHLYTQRGVLLRGLGDRDHFKIPLWRDMLERFGIVLATPENCAALMKAGQNVLVFPGGAREVTRRKTESYELIWKKRAGFARMAIEHGYDIVPFGAIGADENYRILFDADDVMKTRLWRTMAKHLNLADAGDYLPPFPVGVGFTPLPRPQRFYFGFADRMPTVQLAGQHGDPAAVWKLRQAVARAVRHQITMLMKYRREDRPKSWSRLRQWLAPLQEK